MHHPTDRTVHTTAFVTRAGMRNNSMGPLWGINLTHHIMSGHSISEWTLYLGLVALSHSGCSITEWTFYLRVDALSRSALSISEWTLYLGLVALSRSGHLLPTGLLTGLQLPLYNTEPSIQVTCTIFIKYFLLPVYQIYHPHKQQSCINSQTVQPCVR